MSTAKVWLPLFTIFLLAPLLTKSSPLHPNAVTYFKTDAPAASSVFGSFTCDTCRAFFGVVRALFDKGLLWDEIVKISIDVCEAGGIEDHTVCNGIVHLFKVS